MQRRFYDFVDLFRGKNTRETQDKRPGLKEFIDVMEAKLSNLNKPDQGVLKAIIEEAHREVGATRARRGGKRVRTRAPSRQNNQPWSDTPVFPTRKVFDKLVKNLSNSNAKDYMGLSTKNLKTILNYNRQIGTCLFYLCERIFKEGIWPDCLKEDKISMLYKRKGEREMAKSYRPITIAPTVGKVVEKILAHELDKINDANKWNHAYIKAKSCQSAVINVFEITYEYKSIVNKLRAKGYQASTIVLCEDISSAFESIDGSAITQFLKPFDTNPEFKICDMILSYLDRKSLIHENGSSGILKRLDQGRSSPQGSILSPRFWRIFDGLATRAFANSLERFVKCSQTVEAAYTCCYADDHCTLIVVKWRGELSSPPAKVVDTILFIRQMFDEATKVVGCGMNESKSEIITDLNLKQLKKDCYSDSYFWLGYSFKIKDSLIHFTEEKFNTRKFEIRNYVRSIFQYAPAISMRRRIFSVYIQSIIDYYLISLIFENTNKTNYLEQFQREILRGVVSVGRYCAGAEIERRLCIDPVLTRLIKACGKFQSYLITPEPDKVAVGDAKRSRDIATRIRQISQMVPTKKKGKKKRNNRFDEKFVMKWAEEARARFKNFRKVKRQ